MYWWSARGRCEFHFHLVGAAEASLQPVKALASPGALVFLPVIVFGAPLVCGEVLEGEAPHVSRFELHPSDGPAALGRHLSKSPSASFTHHLCGTGSQRGLDSPTATSPGHTGSENSVPEGRPPPKRRELWAYFPSHCPKNSGWGGVGGFLQQSPSGPTWLQVGRLTDVQAHDPRPRRPLILAGLHSACCSAGDPRDGAHVAPAGASTPRKPWFCAAVSPGVSGRWCALRPQSLAFWKGLLVFIRSAFSSL